ncbi:120.7 kDa protein in NOF-FB transposable element, partial [Camponotus floridanus]
FLYTCMVNSSKEKYPTTQMLSESHTTIAIWMWLIQWIQSGASFPHEVTCDVSTALLTAVIQAF